MAYYLVEISPSEGADRPAETLDYVGNIVMSQTSKDSLRFKVFGENKIVFIGKDEEPKKVLDDMNEKIVGSVKMTTTLIRLYEPWAQNFLGVDHGICDLRTTAFLKPQRLVYVHATVGAPGMGMEELRKAWKAEADAVLGPRANGQVDFRLFKAVVNRRVIVFFNVPSADDLDGMMSNVPIALDPRTSNDLHFPVVKEVRPF